MRRRRRLLAVMIAVSAPAVGLVVACSFPEIRFGSVDADAQAAEAGGDTGTGIDGGDGAKGDALVVGDVDLSDVASFDASASVDANSCDAKPLCDCDEDLYLALNCDAGDLVLQKDGGDCDDLNGNIHPNQNFSDTIPNTPPGLPGKGGDWDCSGKVDKSASEGEWCTGGGVPPLDTPCTGGTGFAKTVGCGMKGDLNKCISQPATPLGVKCVQQFEESKTQFCK